MACWYSHNKYTTEIFEIHNNKIIYIRKMHMVLLSNLRLKQNNYYIINLYSFVIVKNLLYLFSLNRKKNKYYSV